MDIDSPSAELFNIAALKLNQQREGSINKRSFTIIHASAVEERKTITIKNELMHSNSLDNLSDCPFTPDGEQNGSTKERSELEMDADRFSKIIREQDRLNDELDADRFSKLIKQQDTHFENIQLD
jgi:hypothetical protein